MLHDIKHNPNTVLDLCVSKLQEINNDLSSLLKSFGTYNIDDLITICFGGDFLNKETHFLIAGALSVRLVLRFANAVPRCSFGGFVLHLRIPADGSGP